MSPTKLLFPVVALLVAAPIARAAEAAQKVAFASVPAAVQKAVRAVLDKGKVGTVERSKDGNEITYSVEIIRQGNERGYTFGEDGRLLSTEVSLDETPPPVQATIRREASSNQIVSIDKSATEVPPTYDVTVEKSGHESSFTVAADGALVSMEFTFAETPPSVQATIKSAIGPASIDHIEKTFAPGPPTFDVDFTRAGHRHDLFVSEDGTLLSITLALADTPPLVQATIRAAVGPGRIDRIERSVEAGKNLYDVEFTAAGRPRAFRVGAEGRLVGTHE